MLEAPYNVHDARDDAEVLHNDAKDGADVPHSADDAKVCAEYDDSADVLHNVHDARDDAL